MKRRTFGVSPSLWFLLMVIVSLAGALGAQTAVESPAVELPGELATATAPQVPATASPDPARPVSEDPVSVVDSGTNGDIFMTSPAPFGQSGIVLQAKPSWPYVVAKTGTSDANSGFTVYNSSNAELMRVRGDGKVGIGTPNPGHLFDVHGIPSLNGDTRELMGLYDTSAVAAGVGGALTFGGRWDAAGSLAGQFSSVEGFKENSTVGDYAGALSFQTRVNGGQPTERVRIDSAGKVGIGTSIPQATLDVIGNIRLKASNTAAALGTFSLGGTDAAGTEHRWTHIAGAGVDISGVSTNNYQLYEYPRTGSPSCCILRLQILPATTTNGVLFLSGNGALGIRRNPFMGALEVSAPNATSNNPNLATSYQGFMLTNGVDATAVIRTLAGGVAQVTTDGVGRSLSFASGQFVEAMRIDPAGLVGIGIAVPTARLHVGGDILANGNISATGTIYARYQDVAEWVPAKSDMLPGTVVILNPEVSNEVMPSSDRYDVRVAGVVSGQPGLLLGEAGESKEQIATTGRVRVMVDATAAPIRIGDLLVTSDKPGMAMRSVPLDLAGVPIHRPGTIIGKALEPLARGEGEILVLLSLQ